MQLADGSETSQLHPENDLQHPPGLATRAPHKAELPLDLAQQAPSMRSQELPLSQAQQARRLQAQELQHAERREKASLRQEVLAQALSLRAGADRSQPRPSVRPDIGAQTACK
jgi:hypothetical protein